MIPVEKVTRNTQTMGMENAEKIEFRLTAEEFRNSYATIYSYREEAVVREYITNAIDAHIMADKLDTPIKIYVPTNLQPLLIIEDEGIGLEKIETILTFNQSTKTRDNKTNGRLGKGAKSAYAIADTFTVTFTKDGWTEKWVAYIDDQGMPMRNRISRTETPDKGNGVRIEIPISAERMHSILLALQKILCFVTYPYEIVNDPDLIIPKLETTTDNTQIFLKDVVTTWTETKSYYCDVEDKVVTNEIEKTFEVGDCSINSYEVVGDRVRMDKLMIRQANVVYPVDVQQLDDDTEEKLNALTNNIGYGYNNKCLIIDVPIGTVEFQPSREQLTYDGLSLKNIQSIVSETINLIIKKYLDVVDAIVAKKACLVGFDEDIPTVYALYIYINTIENTKTREYISRYIKKTHSHIFNEDDFSYSRSIIERTVYSSIHLFLTSKVYKVEDRRHQQHHINDFSFVSVEKDYDFEIGRMKTIVRIPKEKVCVEHPQLHYTNDDKKRVFYAFIDEHGNTNRWKMKARRMMENLTKSGGSSNGNHRDKRTQLIIIKYNTGLFKNVGEAALSFTQRYPHLNLLPELVNDVSLIDDSDLIDQEKKANYKYFTSIDSLNRLHSISDANAKTFEELDNDKTVFLPIYRGELTVDDESHIPDCLSSKRIFSINNANVIQNFFKAINAISQICEFDDVIREYNLIAVPYRFLPKFHKNCPNALNLKEFGNTLVEMSKKEVEEFVDKTDVSKIEESQYIKRINTLRHIFDPQRENSDTCINKTAAALFRHMNGNVLRVKHKLQAYENDDELVKEAIEKCNEFRGYMTDLILYSNKYKSDYEVELVISKNREISSLIWAISVFNEAEFNFNPFSCIDKLVVSNKDNVVNSVVSIEYLQKRFNTINYKHFSYVFLDIFKRMIKKITDEMGGIFTLNGREAFPALDKWDIKHCFDGYISYTEAHKIKVAKCVKVASEIIRVYNISEEIKKSGENKQCINTQKMKNLKRTTPTVKRVTVPLRRQLNKQVMTDAV